MSADRETYCVGESIHIEATGNDVVPAIGDFPNVFWAVTDASGETVFESSNPLDAMGNINGTLRGSWDQRHRFNPRVSDVRDGTQVPPGEYTIWFFEAHRPSGGNGAWRPAHVCIADCSAPGRVDGVVVALGIALGISVGALLFLYARGWDA